jgi:hypothetical protein
VACWAHARCKFYEAISDDAARAKEIIALIAPLKLQKKIALPKEGRTVTIQMKRDGFRWFDVGGMDSINTPQITEFKRAMNGREYRLVKGRII